MSLPDEKVPLISPVEDKVSYGCFHPKGVGYRYTVLLVISLICFGSYFVYDEIQPIGKSIESSLHIGDSQFLLLYSVYSFPNMVLCFFGGILGDKIGLRVASLIFCTFCVIGAFLTALGPQLVVGFGSLSVSPLIGYIIMVAGRVVFGIGGESLNVLQTSMVALWFRDGQALAVAMGLTLSMSRLGDFLSLALGGNLANWFGGYTATLWIGAGLMTVSLVACIVYSIMDKVAEKHFTRVVDPSQNELNFKAVLNFDIRFWAISFLCLTYYSGVTPFIGLCSNFLQDKYGFSKTEANHYSSVTILTPMILSPFLGKLLDVLGRRPYFIILGSFFILPAHLIGAFTDWNPLIFIIPIGLSFSLVPSALWPAVPLVVNEKELSTAYGMMTAIQNAGLGLVNYVVGYLAQHVSLFWAMIFFAVMDTLGFLGGILLLVLDKRRDGVLTASPKSAGATGSIN